MVWYPACRSPATIANDVSGLIVMLITSAFEAMMPSTIAPTSVLPNGTLVFT